MNGHFASVCDDFYVSSRLFLKLEMGLGRETVLHFFDRLGKSYPQMRKFRRRNDGCLVLEEEPPDSESRRWVRLESNSLRFGYFAPPTIEEAREFSAAVLEHAPYYLTFSEIDYDHVELIYGFDLQYRGNHDQLVAETLWADHPLGSILLGDDVAHVIDAQPYFGIALTPDCDVQAYVETKSRTTTYEVRTGEHERLPLSVFLTLRKYWDMAGGGSLAEAHAALFDRANALAEEKVVPLLVRPLAQAIASRL